MTQLFPVPRRLEAARDPHAPMVRTMGLIFRNCLGLAAGVDRTGEQLPVLRAMEAGHIEIGTVSDPSVLKITTAEQPSASILGVNVGSGKPGFSAEVFADFRACLEAVLACSDFIVFNFSNDDMRRPFASDGADYIIATARAQINDNTACTGRRIPILAKVHCDPFLDTLAEPSGATELLDGFVIVGERTDRLTEVRRAFPHNGIISVGGAVTLQDVVARRRAGADLVQMHRAFADRGAAHVQRIVHDLQRGVVHG